MNEEVAVKRDTLNNYAIVKTLGSGLNSKVKLGQDMTTGQNVALKIMKNDAMKQECNLKAMKTEYEVLLQLQHPNIIKLLELDDSGVYKKKTGKVRNGTVYAALEIAENGEIFDYLSSTGRFSEPVVKYFFKKMLDALNHVHCSGFVHRDLKPDNQLLDSEFNLKLADFGFAILAAGRDGTGKLKTTLGTEGYMAPEIFNKMGNYRGVPVDVFSAGVILFIFMAGIPPFKKAIPNKDPQYNLMCSNKYEKFWDFHEKRLKMKFSDEFKALINSMLSFDATHRPSIAEIYASEWFSTGKTATDEEIKKEFTIRKKYVEAALEAERLEKEARKAKQKQMLEQMKQQMNSQGLAFGEISAKRSSTKGGDMEQIFTDAAEFKSDMNTRFAGFKQEINFRPIERGSISRGSIIGTQLDECNFYKALQYICEQQKAEITKQKQDKFNVSFMQENKTVEMKVVFHKEQCQEGLQIAEFIKLDGELYYMRDFVERVKDTFKGVYDI